MTSANGSCTRAIVDHIVVCMQSSQSSFGRWHLKSYVLHNSSIFYHSLIVIRSCYV